jgi:hypothetical protein
MICLEYLYFLVFCARTASHDDGCGRFLVVKEAVQRFGADYG